MPLIYGFTVLLVFQLIGEVSVRALDLPVPGPVAGMLLLLLTLIVKRGVPAAIDHSANGLLSHLSLLFVPAGVGLIVYFERIGDEWLPIALTLVFSTLLTMAVTAWVMIGTQRLFGKRSDADG